MRAEGRRSTVFQDVERDGLQLACIDFEQAQGIPTRKASASVEVPAVGGPGDLLDHEVAGHQGAQSLDQLLGVREQAVTGKLFVMHVFAFRLAISS